MALVTLGGFSLGACGRSHEGDDHAARAGVGARAGSGGAAGLGAGGVAAGLAGSAGSVSASDAGSAGRVGGGDSGSTFTGEAGAEGGGRAGVSGAAGAPSLGGSSGSGAAVGGAAGQAGQGGRAGTGGRCWLDVPQQACEGMFAPLTAPLIDLSTYTAEGRWSGAMPGSISGGTSLYHASDGENFELEASNGELHATGLVPSHGTSGLVLWFGPCIDASFAHGLHFPVAGELGNSDFKVAIQTNADYPIDVLNERGACSRASCETGLADCKFPWASIPVLATVEDVWEPFSVFVGGSPESTVGRLSDWVGLEFQITCLSDSACPVSFTLGSISLWVL